MVLMLWQHLFSLDNVMCTEAHKDMTIEEVTMAVDTFTLQMPDHLCFLFQKGLLETIVVKQK